MKRLLLACAALAFPCLAQNTPDLVRALGFEVEPIGTMPGAWSGTPPATIAVDDKIVHSGRWSVRLQRNADSTGTFSVLTKSLPIDFGGQTLTLRGFLRTEDVSEYAGLWAREDGESPNLAFDNMQNRGPRGTTGWTEYTINLPIHKDARQLIFGVLMSKTGTAWADDLQLLVDGKPIREAPKVERAKTALDIDHEFDGGSKISFTQLSTVQVSNLATLGKVWGFLKYHHPAVVTGQRHWDYELFRVLPKLLAATDRATGNQTMLDWVTALGPVAKCQPCATLEEADLQLRPALAWLSDQKLLGEGLSKSLSEIHANRLPGKQFYVSRARLSNPAFEHELQYRGALLPDPGVQLLALYRFWNIVEYWSPNRDIVGENWDDVLTAFIPKIALAKGDGDYPRQMMALIAMDHDTHANLWSSLALRPPVGPCRLPVVTRFVENRAVITGYTADKAKDTSGLLIGDIVSQLDGVPVTKLVETWSPYSDSNDAARLRDIGRELTRGTCGETRVGIVREGKESEVKTARVPQQGLNVAAGTTHDQPGDTFRLLSEQVAYLKLSSVKNADLPRYLDSAAGTKGLIVDIRNYPSEFVPFTLGGMLVDHDTRFAKFTYCDLSNPGAFHWRDGDIIHPVKPHYSGKVIVLVDEISQSQAEYTTMALRATGAIVVGSTTAGADGDVSQIALPGGLTSMISGLGVFYPDKKPTQRIGIVPDVVIKPTIDGLRAGKDELLDEAIRRIVGGN